jgi:C1A family cysteine protease
MPRPSTVSLPKYHWRRDPVDTRDHIFKTPAPTTPPPSIVDMRNYASPIENQGNLGSCTGNAIAGQIELIQRKVNPAKGQDVSRLFIYYQERLLEGTIRYDNGAYIRDGIKACYTWGAPLESLWPYIINRFALKPSNAAYADALRRKVTSYQRCTNFSSVKSALAAGYPVTVGFDVYSSFEGTANTNTGMMPYPNTRTEQYLGGHAVCIVGYNDNLAGGRFICRNSWGSNWGNNGYFYMPYQVIQNANMSNDFWAIVSVSNP